MTFSIIIPSYNQDKYIEQTLQNVISLKKEAAQQGITIEILLFDSDSKKEVQTIIHQYRTDIDVLEIAKDKGQYDAINKGLNKVKGDYWTWLNTDDLLIKNNFFKLVEILKSKPKIDYIFGGIDYIDAESKFIKTYAANNLYLENLYSKNPGIYQPGSFFKTNFTKEIGLLQPYKCCFDYEYILRCLSKNANFYCCNFSLAAFRFHNESKTGSIIPIFITEQLEISKKYGRKFYHFLTWFSYLRLLKHKIIR